MFVVINIFLFIVFAVDGKLLFKRRDGLYNYYLGSPTVPQSTSTATTVTLPQGYLVYGSRFEYVSGKGSSDVKAQAGTLGDTLFGSWVTVYLNKQSASVLVPSFGYDSKIQATYTSTTARGYTLVGADITTLTGGYDLWCAPRWIAMGTSVSIWNSDPVKTDNVGSETIRWYLIVARTATPSTTGALSASRSGSVLCSASESLTGPRSLTTSLVNTRRQRRATVSQVDRTRPKTGSLSPRRRISFGNASDDTVMSFTWTESLTLGVRRVVSRSKFREALTQRLITRALPAAPRLTARSGPPDTDETLTPMLTITGRGGAVVAGTLSPTSANKPSVVTRTVAASECSDLQNTAFPTPSPWSLLPAAVRLASGDAAGSMVLSTVVATFVCVLWNAQATLAVPLP